MNLPTIIPPGSFIHRILCNENGMRAGTRIAIFLPIWLALRGLLLPALVPVLLRSLHPPVNAKSEQIFTITPGVTFIYPFSEFLVLLLTCWIMSRIERRRMGSY